MSRAALYRMRRNDELLYVGVSYNPWLRFGAHLSTKDWAQTVTQMDVEWFDNRSAALAAERLAISKEKPLSNLADYATDLAKKAEVSSTEGGRVLSAWLAGTGMTQEQLGDALGVHFTAMSRTLTGQRPLPRRAAVKLAQLTEGAVPVSVWGYSESKFNSAEFDNAVKALVEAGMCQKQIVRELGTTIYYVGKAFARANLKVAAKEPTSKYADAIRRCAEAGLTQSQAAKRIGIAQGSVSIISHKLGIKFADGRKAPRGERSSASKVERLRNLALQGLTITEAAREAGITQPYASQLKKQHGIDFRVSKYATPRGATA